MTVISAALCTTLVAIITDTHFYHPAFNLLDILTNPTITPLNSFRYNASTSNLAIHGLHPWYQHLVASLPILLGPALLLLSSTIKNSRLELPEISAVTGTIFLSAIPHQEPRFLLPVVPLILSSIRLPRSRRHRRTWLAAWAGFNIILGVLMGIYHQGGVIPAQTWLGHQQHSEQGTLVSENFWWRTYSPPVYIAGHSTAKTTDLMGIPFHEMQATVIKALSEECGASSAKVRIVAPASSIEMDAWERKAEEDGIALEAKWMWRRHLNLDDMDFEEDGVWPAVKRVIGRRGLVIWEVSRTCRDDGGPLLGGDW